MLKDIYEGEKKYKYNYGGGLFMDFILSTKGLRIEPSITFGDYGKSKSYERLLE